MECVCLLKWFFIPEVGFWDQHSGCSFFFLLSSCFLWKAFFKKCGLAFNRAQVRLGYPPIMWLGLIQSAGAFKVDGSLKCMKDSSLGHVKLCTFDRPASYRLHLSSGLSRQDLEWVAILSKCIETEGKWRLHSVVYWQLPALHGLQPSGSVIGFKTKNTWVRCHCLLPS